MELFEGSEFVELAVESSADTRHAESRSLRASIIIVNYNAKEKLLRCLESVLRSIKSDCEIIVVDNASADGTADLIEINFSEVTLIRSQTNLGFGAGNNLAARSARGRYLIFLNPDTLVEEGWIEALLVQLESNTQAGLVTSRILLADEPNRINACGNAVHFTGLTLCRGLGQSREAYSKVEEVNAISGAAFAACHELIDALNGFDEDMFLYMEDTDLSWRARMLGWRCFYTPDSIVRHHYTLRIGPLKVFYQERNRYLMLLKTLKWPTLVILVPSLLLAEVITWGFVLYNDRANFKNKLRAYAWITSNWSEIMSKRSNTQLSRCVTDRELLRNTTFRMDFSQASKGLIGKLAQFLFDPLFLVLKAVVMTLVWW
jgi:GT2 family glycosyltransferase